MAIPHFATRIADFGALFGFFLQDIDYEMQILWEKLPYILL